MKITQRLKLEKELYFIKYFFQRPFYLVGEAVWSVIKNIQNLLFVEFIILVVFLFDDFFRFMVTTYPIKIGKKVIFMFLAIIFTFILKLYLTQEFQQDYIKSKEEKLKKQLDKQPIADIIEEETNEEEPYA